MISQQVNRITIRFPRLLITFGYVVAIAGVLATFGIMYAIVWAMFAAFPNL